MASFSWKCPYCNCNTTIVDSQYQEEYQNIYIRNRHTGLRLHHLFILCPNEDCQKFTLKATLHQGEALEDGAFRYGENLNTWDLLPESHARPYSKNVVPAPLIEDYTEACRIVSLSPKASATLARRCLQGMIRDFFSATVKPGKLLHEINSIKGEVTGAVWNAIDSTRKIGNIGAHMEADINLILDVEPGEAEALIWLIEFLFDSWYVKKAEDDRRLAEIRQMAAAKQQLKN